MGANLTRFWHLIDYVYYRDCVVVAMVGLDASGKTSILYQMMTGELKETIPTHDGFHVETVRVGRFKCCIWEGKRRGKHRRIWGGISLYERMRAIIYVVDSSDTERIEESRQTLHQLLGYPEIRESDNKLLVFANKNDLQGAMPTDELAEKLCLNSIHDREWRIQAASAKTGEGLFEGILWLERTLKATKSPVT